MNAEVPKRLAPRPETLRELFLRSGNLCAFPGCTARMLDEEGNFIGQICHIEAAEHAGERFNPTMTNEERRAAANLMLMCYEHHVVTNDVRRYPVAIMREMKAAHEQHFLKPTRALEQRVDKIKWGALFAMGLLAGVAVDEFAHKIRSFLDLPVDPPVDTKPIRLRELLQQRLRYAPSGVIHFYARDPARRAVGEQLLKVLESAGWHILRLEEPPSWATKHLPDLDHSILMAFEVADKHQLANTHQAIEEFFALCGFSAPDKNAEVIRSDEQTVIVYIPFLVHHRYYVPYTPRPPDR